MSGTFVAVHSSYDDGSIVEAVGPFPSKSEAEAWIETRPWNVELRLPYEAWEAVEIRDKNDIT